jgi:hypothetical protein
MYSLINYYFYDKDLNMAHEQINFYQERIKTIQNKNGMNQKEKDEKIKKIEFTINCIKYTFSL